MKKNGASEENINERYFSLYDLLLATPTYWDRFPPEANVEYRDHILSTYQHAIWRWRAVTDIKLLLELSRSNSTLCPLQHNTVLRRRIKVAYGHYPTAYLYDLLRAAHRLLGPIWHVSNRSSSRDLRVYKIAASYLITVAQECRDPNPGLGP